ncbi:TonB-dependent receptor [Denitratisoma oestradiolicum]|uniref:TonB-dependent receptor n=1 Tax=Denitratisoma oestradiolicum TaxID=311182 RepID=A0A6S6Y2R5_9PROT|nr:TonB-dependent receptor [Denitratisoma oestradiolicum]TWO79184.1 hypothetical protein CBW56_15985 [Denitratisoma oestradiolicum]CAB1370825.1 conserved protein of unknown function [Denitratisoma oestradiolicum]
MQKTVVQKYAVRLLSILVATAFSDGARSETRLEEVVVTAQKRQEKLQDVPISITAISGAQLETRGIDGVSGLNSLAPNLMFRNNPSSNSITTIAIRGSVTGQPAIWMDPPIGTYVDGVYIGKAQGGIFDIIDLERVEVLRGPQGTLFGRNTEGGAVNFISRKPSGEFGGTVGLEVGNYGRTVEKAVIDLPKMGLFSIKLGYRKEDQDGWVKNTTSGVGDFGKRDKEAFQLAARMDISNHTKVDYKFDHSETDGTPPVNSLYSLRGWAGTPAAGALRTALEGFVTTDRPKSAGSPAGYPIFERIKTDGHALTVSHQLNQKNEIKYIYAKRDMDYDDGNSGSGTDLLSVATSPTTSVGAARYYQRHTKYKSDSHELQWIGNTERMNYVLGLYSFKDDGTTLGPQDFSVFGLPMMHSDYGVKTDAKAWFGQLDYKVTEALTATFGMRHTTEKKSGWTHRFRTSGYDGPFVAEVVPMTSYDASWSANTPVAALGYKMTETTNLYARVARGFKSGGFSAENTNIAALRTPFNPERSLSMEVGVKSSLLDNRAQVSAAYFRNKLTDLHITQLLPGTSVSVLTNAGKATYKGIELEGAFQLTDGWRLQGNYGYLDAKFDEYIDNALNIAGRPLIDTAGNRLPPYAPKHTFNLTLDGRLARTAWGTLRAILDYTYTAKMNLYAVNKSLTAANAGGSYVVGLDDLPAIRNLNARLLLADIPVGGPGKADVSIWIKNLTDEKNPIQKIDVGTSMTANWQEPRTYGISVNYKW